MKITENTGPIPGENFLSEKRNYVWHRPPDIETFDETVSYVIQRISEEQTSELVFSLMEIDRPLTNIVSGLMLQGVARGKFQIDMAILAAGPVYRYLKMIADNKGIKYNDGLNKKRMPITPTVLKAALGIIDEEPVQEKEVASESAQEAPTVPMGGLMGSPEPVDQNVAPAEEQAAMLGMREEEEV